MHVFPILNPPPSSLPIPSLWIIPVHQPHASSIVHQTWTGNSFLTWYFTCFNAIPPNLSTLSLSHRVHKTVLYISVSFAVSYIPYLFEYFHLSVFLCCVLGGLSSSSLILSPAMPSSAVQPAEDCHSTWFFFSRFICLFLIIPCWLVIFLLLFCVLFLTISLSVILVVFFSADFPF